MGTWTASGATHQAAGDTAKGILDDFGSGANLVMGAAVDTSGDTHSGDNGGTSMAVTLAVADAPVHTFTYRWSQVASTLPASGLLRVG